MKYEYKKYAKMVVTLILTIFMCNVVFAHSGRTDSNGGHRDNQNKSGLGSYHYHCGGYPAHLHNNGVCPYSSNVTKELETVPNVTEAISVQIKENIGEIKIGESKQLSASILPQNTTDKKVSWKSSDESIIQINQTGRITAVGKGLAYITVSTVNKRTDTIAILVKEVKESSVPNKTIDQSSVNKDSDINLEDSNLIGQIVGISTLGIGGYLGYKKYKERK